jgi:hypothetical protein
MNRRLDKELVKHGFERSEDEAGNVSVHASKNLRFKIPSAYPFKPPVCLYKGADYISHLVQLQSKLAAFIAFNQIKLPCVCCHNLLCDWSPASSLNELVVEFNATHKRLIKIQKYASYLTKLNMDAFLVKFIGTFLDF